MRSKPWSGPKALQTVSSFLQSGRADLTVMTSGDALTAAQVAQIRDIVLSKSNITAQNITIVEVK